MNNVYARKVDRTTRITYTEEEGHLWTRDRDAEKKESERKQKI